MAALEPTPFQESILRIPEKYSLFLGGGRGGGKSYALLFLVISHAQRYGADSRILYIRKSFPAITEFEEQSREIFREIYGGRAKYNGSKHVWRLPGGATFELGQLDKVSDYDKYQGRSFNLIIVDEGGQFAIPDQLDELASNLRGPKDIPTRLVYAANPGGPGHHWLAKRHVLRAEPAWTPYYEEETEREWVHVPSTFNQNPMIDQVEYERAIRGASKHDPDLQKAWLLGDWKISRGAYFSDLISGVKVELGTPEEWIGWIREQTNASYLGRHLYLAHDWGSSAPSVTYLMMESPGMLDFKNRFWPKGSVLMLDEYASYLPKKLHKGTGETPGQLAKGIKAMCKRWQISPIGCADDACFAKTAGFDNDSIAEQFANHGVHFSPAKKGDRVTGWTHMRAMMEAAGSKEFAQLVADPRCAYFWQTVPTLTRHPRKPEDIADGQPDHGADAARYGINWKGLMIATSGHNAGAG